MKITPYAEPRFAPLPPTRNVAGTSRIDWLAITAALKTNPGQWAAIGTLPADASMGNRGVRLRRRGVETTTRSNGDGTATIWACYVGTGTAPAMPEPFTVPADVMAAWFGVAS